MTERLFRTHYIRKQECLDGIWNFEPVDGPRLPETYTDTMAVPSCWEMSMTYCRYSGFAAYSRDVYTERDSNLRFVFKGVTHTCKVFLDGEELGGHYNGFSGFSVIAYQIRKGWHKLELWVDNSFSERSALHIPNDYFTYGGITRPVFMEYVSDCFIERTEFEPRFSDGRWTADIRVFIKNIADREQNVNILVSLAGSETVIQGIAKANMLTHVSGSMTFENIKPWSPDTPSLFELRCTLNETDDLCDRVGFRVLSYENKKICVNGEPVFLKGVNRHEDHGAVGCSLPLQLMYDDIALMKDLGCNAVRTCHYQNDERFLDLCDENGILVWEESHDRGGDTARITNPLFIEQSMASMHEMLEYHYNHPSIIIWACLNEAAADTEEGREVYKFHLDCLKSDRSRFCTYAGNKYEPGQMDLCCDMTDISAYNMYPYWYGDDACGLGKIKKMLRENGNDSKPLIISEYGAGAIYGLHDVMKPRWSEEYQAEVLHTVTQRLVKDDDVAGIFIWMFADTRIKGTVQQQLTRPGGKNNKGLVNEFRKPKMAYYKVREIFKNE
jgi:beta-glucuronidase